jgi:hypothetical protein
VAVLLIAQTDHEMISTIIIENNPQALAALKTKIEHCCPYLDVNGVAQTIRKFLSLGCLTTKLFPAMTWN